MEPRSIYPVFLEAWQLECCGHSYMVGDEVTWDLAVRPVRDGWETLGVDLETVGLGHGLGMLAEEHHGADDVVKRVRGTIHALQLATVRDDALTLTAVDGVGVRFGVPRNAGAEHVGALASLDLHPAFRPARH